MLRFRSSFNGVQNLLFNHGFRQLALYSTEVNPKFVNYLIDNLGFSSEQALITTSRFTHSRLLRGGINVTDFEFVENANSVVAFLKKIGLQQSHIRNAIEVDPLILMCNVKKTLIPKTESFKKLGFSETDIAEIVSVNPRLYFSRLDTAIVPAIQALKENLDSERQVISILKNQHLRLSAIPKSLVPNVALLRTYGVPMESIQKCLNRNLFTFLRKTEYFKDALIRVEDGLGIPRSSPQFLAGVRLLSSNPEETIESKKQVFKSFGWNDSDVATLVMSNPSVFGLSEDNIKKRLDYLMNEVGYEPRCLYSRSYFFTYSLEKRIMLRQMVLSVLKKKGLMTEYFLHTVVCYTESKFLNKFVLPFKEVHQVYSKHAGISMEMLAPGLPKLNSSIV